jgi:hypothetical protein
LFFCRLNEMDREEIRYHPQPRIDRVVNLLD